MLPGLEDFDGVVGVAWEVDASHIVALAQRWMFRLAADFDGHLHEFVAWARSRDVSFELGATNSR